MRTHAVRPATVDAVPRLLEMAVAFIVSRPEYAVVLDWTPEGLESFCGVMATSETTTVLVLELDGLVVGMLAVAMVPNPFGGRSWAEEVAWWLDEASRGGTGAYRLLGSAKVWARQNGASMLKMVAPWGSRIGVFYRRQGFAPLETAWILRL